MRLYLLTVLLLLASSFARAQDSLATPRPAAADTARLRPVAAADTAAALHRLFAAERHKGRVTLTVCGIVAGVSGLAFAVKPDVVTLVAAGLLAVGSVVVAVPAAIQTATYSMGRERRIVQAWQRHQPPRRVRRQLRAEYFQPDDPRATSRK